MPTFPFGTINNATAIANQITAPTLWQKAVDMYEENSDFWQTYEGSGESNVILTNNDLNAGDGTTMKIRVESGYYNEPHYADETFDDEADFEEDLFANYELTLDVIRHGSSGSERAEEKMGLRGAIGRQSKKLGNWMGRIKTENLDMMFVNKVLSTNKIRPNGKTLDTIATADGLSLNFVSTAAGLLRRLGGQRAKTGTMANGAPSRKLVLVACSDACAVLRQDTAWQTIVSNASDRGKSNSLFKGVIDELDGIAVVEREVIDHDGEGAIGSPMNPRALLGNAIASGSGALNITGGGNATSAAKTQKLYYKYFPNYLYKFSDGTLVTANGLSNYCIIVNPPNAATDPNKYGMYKYTTGNDGNKIAVTQRLAGAIAGIAHTTVGTVVWDATKHTDVHPAGALVLPCNAKGEPLGYSFLLGAAAALRGYGKFRNRLDTEMTEGNYWTKKFIRTYMGQKIREDRLGRQPGLVVLEHALHYKDLPLVTTV